MRKLLAILIVLSLILYTTKCDSFTNYHDIQCQNLLAKSKSKSPQKYLNLNTIPIEGDPESALKYCEKYPSSFICDLCYSYCVKLKYPNNI